MARRSCGFSLVELMIALLFTMILMAGMATVFRTSLSNACILGEKLSSVRRNRIASELLYDDLNSAGMALVDLTSPLPASEAHPAFQVVPNREVADGQGDVTRTDELYMACDQPLPFDGKLVSGGGAGNGTGGGETAIDKVLSGGEQTAGDNTYVIECGDATYAESVKAGMVFHIKDDLSHAALTIASVNVSGSKVTVTTPASLPESTEVTGRGDTGTLRPTRRLQDSRVIFIQPAQMARYRIEMLKLDPSSPDGLVPCLVRAQGAYNPAGDFVPEDTQIVTEHVVGFRVYLSADSGMEWAGLDVQDDAGWAKIQDELNAQLAKVNRKDYTTTAGNLGWYRDIPLLVRIDLTTRTAVQRAEYTSGGGGLGYKTLTQSVVMVPRHFGLPLK